MSITVNAKTGLRESHHDYYNLPIVHQKGLGRLRFDGQLRAVHTVPLPSGG